MKLSAGSGMEQTGWVWHGLLIDWMWWRKGWRRKGRTTGINCLHLSPSLQPENWAWHRASIQWLCWICTFCLLYSVPHSCQVAQFRVSTNWYEYYCAEWKDQVHASSATRMDQPATRVQTDSRVWTKCGPHPLPHLPPQLAPFSSARSAQLHMAGLNLACLGGSFVASSPVFMGRVWGPGEGSCLPWVTGAAAVTETQTFAIEIPVGSLALEPHCLFQITQLIDKKLNSKWWLHFLEFLICLLLLLECSAFT